MTPLPQSPAPTLLPNCGRGGALARSPRLTINVGMPAKGNGSGASRANRNDRRAV